MMFLSTASALLEIDVFGAGLCSRAGWGRGQGCGVHDEEPGQSTLTAQSNTSNNSPCSAPSRAEKGFVCDVRYLPSVWRYQEIERLGLAAMVKSATCVRMRSAMPGIDVALDAVTELWHC
eukprot:3666351-Rhodomonas_salina.3